VRVFIAVPLPADLKARLVSLQQEFRRLQLEATWVRESGFHLTLKFLGEVDSSLIEPITSCMTTVAQHHQPFSLTVSRVGSFPHASNPRVLWVGVQDVTGTLGHIQQRLDARLSQLGFSFESRPFAPHLTLARIKRVPRRDEFLGALKAHGESVWGQLAVDHMELVESQLQRTGARYAIVNTVHFSRAIDTLGNR
jgi:RNA 2',3'-cyclic 3'-phosphodiesterase